MDDLNQTLYKIQNDCDEMRTMLSSLDSRIDSAKATAFAEGLRAGVAAKGAELENQVVILKVNNPEEFSRSQMRDLNQIFINEFKSKLVILSEDSDLCTLHDIDLKAIGLMRIP